jgi:hypothetical protein
VAAKCCRPLDRQTGEGFVQMMRMLHNLVLRETSFVLLVLNEAGFVPSQRRIRDIVMAAI